MELNIGGKDYELSFGLGFIAALDRSYTQKIEGMSFGVGLEMVIPYMEMKNPLALVSLIKAGTNHLKSKPSDKDIESFLEDKAVKGEMDDLFKEFRKSMEVAPFLQQKMKTFKTNIEKQVKAAQKKPTEK